MARYVGDPRFGPVPVEEMLSKHLAKERASLIDMNSARRDVLPSSIEQELAAHGHETIYLSTIDKKGNIVSLIQSNYEGHGTGMVAPGAGFSLHNRGAGFDLTPGRPNSLAGRKRPLHTIIPAFMRKGDVTIGFGIMGGWNQAQAHAQFVANLVDFEQNPQLALESPRFTKQTFDGVDVQLESRVPDAVRQDLAQRGHVVEPAGPFSFVMGNGEAVMRDARRGVNFGASDPRTDGAAIPEQPSTQV
jgi:gamma-glutamyltranspeptidase/glutathione hydrolase